MVKFAFKSACLSLGNFLNTFPLLSLCLSVSPFSLALISSPIMLKRQRVLRQAKMFIVTLKELFWKLFLWNNLENREYLMQSHSLQYICAMCEYKHSSIHSLTRSGIAQLRNTKIWSSELVKIPTDIRLAVERLPTKSCLGWNILTSFAIFFSITYFFP